MVSGFLISPKRPGKNFLRAGDRYPDGIERLRRNVVVEKIHDLMVHACLLLGLCSPLIATAPADPRQQAIA
jgi:hypothetical protein